LGFGPLRAGEGMPGLDYDSKWKSIAGIEDDDLLGEQRTAEAPDEVEAALQAAYANEMAQEQQVDKLKELKIKMAVDAYEKRRPADKVMHHYWIKEAGDPEAIGEYVPTGDERCDVPVYRNEHGLVLSRERQPLGPDSDQDGFGWVIGNMSERRPLYGVQSDDLSVPTLGWQAYTAPEPLPVIRYYTQAAAARAYKENGNKAFQKREWAKAEEWYSKSLGCKMDPAEYAEPYGMLLSNRAEVRLRMSKFSGAAEDAEMAMKYLKSVVSSEEGTKLLKQKTVVRLAKALQALRRFNDAFKVLQDQQRYYPANQEMARLLEDTELALQADARGRGGKSVKGSATPEMLAFVSKLVETIQSEIDNGSSISEFAFPEDLAVALKKLEYTLAKAKSVQGPCLADLQALLRTNGGLRTLLKIIQEQWQSNVDGKVVDAYKLHAVACVAAIVGLACDDCVESLKMAANEAPCFFAVLGGCNRKVEVALCERLIALASGLWEHCRTKTVELIQTQSIVVERAASYLSKATLAEAAGEALAPDSPVVSGGSVEQAVRLLSEMLNYGGRIRKRALRGAAPHLAGTDGEGFFTAEASEVRAVGELVAEKALADPQVLTPREVKNLLVSAQLLIVSGPCTEADENDMAVLSFDEFAGEGAAMRYVDLGAWAETEDGKHASTLLQLVAKALEFRLLVKDRELEREEFKDAFYAGNGYFVVVPLVQAPLPFSEHALLSLAVMAQNSAENVNHIVGLSTIHALIGMPSPDAKPMPSHVDHTLKTSAAARKHAAKLLSRTVETQVCMELLKNAGEKCIKELVKLATQVREDGKGNLESFHDMINVFYIISQLRPGPLARYVPADMLNLFVELSQDPSQEMPREIVKMLLRDPVCEKVLQPIVDRWEEGRAQDPEEELQELSKGPSPMRSLA